MDDAVPQLGPAHGTQALCSMSADTGALCGVEKPRVLPLRLAVGAELEKQTILSTGTVKDNFKCKQDVCD